MSWQRKWEYKYETGVLFSSQSTCQNSWLGLQYTCFQALEKPMELKKRYLWEILKNRNN